PPPDPTAARRLVSAAQARAAILVEGWSDQAALEALARRRGRDLPRECPRWVGQRRPVCLSGQPKAANRSWAALEPTQTGLKSGAGSPIKAGIPRRWQSTPQSVRRVAPACR